MFGEVIGAHEALTALGARETLLSGVGAQVALQLVGAGEGLAAEEPLAAERPLAGVPPQMRLQVRCLAVHFTAAGNVANVLLFLVTQHVTCTRILIANYNNLALINW